MRFLRECDGCKETFRPVGRNTKYCDLCYKEIRRLTGLKTQELRRIKINNEMEVQQK